VKTNKSAKGVFPLWILGIVFIALAILAAVYLPQVFKPSSIGLPSEVDVVKAAELRDQGAFMLDVREQSEWDQFHITGATLIPLGTLTDRLKEIPKDKDVVVVCRSGNRSATGRDILLNAGFTSVTSMAGGMNQWQASGFSVETGP